jgi:hypothetical protein
LKLARILDQHDAIGGLGDLGQKRIGQRRLAGGRAASDQDVAALRYRPTQDRRLSLGHDSGRDIVVEGKDGDCGFADREGGRRHDGRQQTLEPFPRLGQLRRHARHAGMDLGADMMRDEADNALSVRGGEALARVRQPIRQSVDPEPPVGVQHNLDDSGVFEEAGDRRSERRAQHARATRHRLGLEGMNRHLRPRSHGLRRAALDRG